jgi:hypothetical protein
MRKRELKEQLDRVVDKILAYQPENKKNKKSGKQQNKDQPTPENKPTTKTDR